MFKTKTILFFALLSIMKIEASKLTLKQHIEKPNFVTCIKNGIHFIFDIISGIFEFLWLIVKVIHNRIETEFLRTAYETAIALREDQLQGRF